MRQLKFRVFDKKFNKFVDPCDVHINAGTGKAKGVKGGYGYVDTWEIMQFTGLKDRNGVEVYEGDIIDVLDGIDTKAVIVFDDETAAFCCDYLFEGGKSHHLYGLELCEVIGNIFQNKELLE